MLHLLGFFLSTLTPEGFYLILLNVSLSSPENVYLQAGFLISHVV